MGRHGVYQLLILVLAVITGACTSPAASTPGITAAPSPLPSTSPAGPSGTAPASIPPSPAPTPSATVGPIPPGSNSFSFPEFGYVNRLAMRVAVSDLNVRRKPTRNAVSEGKAPKGGLFMVYDWPVTAEGYTWYFGYTLLTQTPGVIPDLPEPIHDGYDEVLAGWMAIGTQDTPFLIPLAPRCPDTRNLLNVVGMTDYERVSCFGSEPLTLEGTFGCGECGGEVPGTFEPEWLASPLELHGLTDPSGEAGPLSLHFPPDGPSVPAEDSVIRVQGHFSDARSTSCRITELGSSGSSDVEIGNAAAEQWCRSRFVVDAYEVIE